MELHFTGLVKAGRVALVGSRLTRMCMLVAAVCMRMLHRDADAGDECRHQQQHHEPPGQTAGPEVKAAVEAGQGHGQRMPQMGQ